MRKVKIIIGLTICGLLLLAFPFLKSNLADGVTADKIKLIVPGMKVEQVLSILGRPLNIDALRGTHNNNCHNPIGRPNFKVNSNTDIKKEIEIMFNPKRICCDGLKEDLDSSIRDFTFTYSEKKLVWTYPMLSVHFDGHNEVSSVYASIYEGFEHYCIYYKGWGIDSLTTAQDKNKVAYFLDDRHFYKLFGQASH